MPEQKQVPQAEKSTKSKDEKPEGRELEEDANLEESETYAVIPPNGGWGWLVVISAFYCNVVSDGIQLTFGVFLSAISDSFQAEVGQVALAGSLMFGIHLLMGPVCAGFSKVFGLRPVTIAGSLICCFGLGISYFATGYWYLYISFGFIGGIGLGLVYMNSLVITSVYFTTLMPLAIAIVVCGTGVGTMIFAALGNRLLYETTWQNSFLLQSALAGSMAIAAASFKPLKPVRVKISPTSSSAGRMRPVAIPGAEETGEPSMRRKTVFIKTNGGRGSVTSLPTMQSAIWNFAEEAVVAKKSKMTCKWRCGRCRKLRKRTDDMVLVLSEIKTDSPRQRRKSYVEKGALHEATSEEASSSPQHGHSSGAQRTVFTRLDFKEAIRNKGFNAIKRTIVAMLDCHLMASFIFVMFTISGAFQMAGFLIVFIYEKERCLKMGFSEDASVNFVIFLGGANMFWRLCLGGLASLPKVNYWALAITAVVLGGLATIFSGFHSSIYYHFGFCFFFGLGIAGFAVFRILLLVDLVGIERIENATGINLLFMGIFCIVSPPFFGWLMTLTDSYDIVFIITGIFIVLSGMMLIGLNKTKV